MSDVLKQPKKLMADAIEQAARSGVARAAEARKAAGVELSADDVNQISGGALKLPGIIIAGPYPVDIMRSPAVTVSSPVALGANVALQTAAVG